MLKVFSVSIALFAAVFSTPVLAQTAIPPTAQSDHAAAALAKCNAMRAPDVARRLGQTASIYETKVTRVYPDLPEVCLIEGYVAPTTGFRIALPLEGWNGKYVQSGCGGACGTSLLFWCDEPLKRGYACLNTDMGHRSTTADWSWARNNLQSRADFGFVATHQATVAGKAVAEAYYGAAPRLSYFLGCSTGGRQGYVAAQRFPDDFDGIIAGAPPIDQTLTGFGLAWSVLSNLDSAGNYILSIDAVRALHEGVVKACDMNDGLRDGLIGDPRACRFDIKTVQCAAGSSAGCLSPAQIGAAQKIYQGPVNSGGRKVGRQGGPMLGSELNWIGDYLPSATRPAQYASFIESSISNTAFWATPAGWTLRDLDFDRDPERTRLSEVLFNAGNPDLRAFRESGGKLLSFQGWADTSVVPGGPIDYYETAERTMGGREATQAFYRFFTVPGMRHCSADGAGGDAINYLEVMENWVERGHAPTRLVGANFNWEGLPLRSLTFPLEPGRIRFMRPSFLYPLSPVYKGRGDANDPDSYRAVDMRSGR